jgi:hypothetical protein
VRLKQEDEFEANLGYKEMLAQNNQHKIKKKSTVFSS